MSNDKAAARRRPKRAPAADRLLKAANELFYRRGIRAVGVDQVVKTADVAKISLYRAFPSKDDLIVAYLRDRDAAFWRDWDVAVASANRVRDQLDAVLAFLGTAIADPAYRGCPFANFTAEFPDRDHAGHRVVEASKGELRSRLVDLCDRIDVGDPEHLAYALFLLIEGAFSVSQTTARGKPFAGDALVWAADALMTGQASTKRTRG